MSFYQIFLRRCYTKLSVKISLFHAFSVSDMQFRRFLQKQLHLCARHAVSTAYCGRFLQETRVFSVCFMVRLQGVVTNNRLCRAACFLTITWVMLPLLNCWAEYRECAARFFCVCMPSARCSMLRIVGWGVYAFSAGCPVCTGVA